MNSAQWHVYLLQCADGTYYCGIAKNVALRVRQHNGLAPGGARYTRGRRPVFLAAEMECAGKSEALKLEIKIKSLPKEQKKQFFTKVR